MRRVLGRLVAACLVAIVVAGPLAAHGMAHPAAFASAEHAGADTMIHKVHGFHCRPVLGWDPVAGVYRVHRHPGICRDYRGCLREQKRCIFLLGRRFEPWSYEAFGSDNARFTACMIRSGCY